MRRRLREAISALRLFASSAPLMIVTPWDDSCGDCSQASADRAGLGYAPRMNRLLPLIFALAGLVLALSPAVARAQAHADTIPVAGKVWTGNPGQPEAEALAILDGTVGPQTSRETVMQSE